MELTQAEIAERVERLSEGINSEVKAWLDPEQIDGKVKIAQACMALYNANGGYLFIGFDNDSMEPLPPPGWDIREKFHADKIQDLVSRHSSRPFEIAVGFSAGGQAVIKIPAGLKVPVAAKRDVRSESGAFLMREHDVYVRTLNANLTVSTAKIQASDWESLLNLCFENREADIGRFLRRHLTPAHVEALTGHSAPATPNLREMTLSARRANEERLADMLRRREIVSDNLGQWSAQLLISPLRPDAVTNQTFLDAIDAANPNYTGWPIWLVSSRFHDESDRPEMRGQAYEAGIVHGRLADFYRYSATGDFFFWRLMQEEEVVSERRLLDPDLMIYRVAETIAVAIAFARALGWGDDATLALSFTWMGLEGRSLEYWANPGTHWSPRGARCHDNIESGYVEIPSSTAVSAVAPYVATAVQRLLAAFNGYEARSADFERIVERMLSRRFG